MPDRNKDTPISSQNLFVVERRPSNASGRTARRWEFRRELRAALLDFTLFVLTQTQTLRSVVKTEPL